MSTLTTSDHDRDSAGLTYVYPVLSRRAGGISLGVNFNTNNACNWRCIYCQVPNLERGVAPDIDLQLLTAELSGFIRQLQSGQFYQQYNLDPPLYPLKDIAISGNGEPTTAKNLEVAIQLIGEIALSHGVFPGSKYVLISNGSLVHQANVQAGLRKLHQFGGELWFKLDSATLAGRKLMNNAVISEQTLLTRLQLAAESCTLKLQTCMLGFHQQLWNEPEKQAYLQLLKTLRNLNIPIAEIMLYGLARASCQPEAEGLQKLSLLEMQEFADKVRLLGYAVSVSE